MRLLRLALALGLAALVAACGERGASLDLWQSSTIRQAKARGRLVVAMEPEFKPFEWIDERGELVGFDVDLCRVLAQEMNVENVEFLRVNFDVIMSTLLSGEADLIVSGMTATPERALRVSYSEPYFHTVTCLLVSREKASDVRGIRDLDDPARTVVVKIGTTGDVSARKRCPRAKIVSFPSENAAALEVAMGRADAFLYDKKSVEQHHERHPDTTFLLLDPVTVEPYAIACRKGDPDTVAWLDLVLHHMRRDGRLKELYAKHGLEDESPPR
jgi:polar amino acid transport system substrate-binding protein